MTTRDAMETLPFLLEVGSEEIPARFMPRALAELAARVGALLDEANLFHEGLEVHGTPRRLALVIAGVQVRQEDREIEVKGPPVKVAFDADGNPTPAAVGFARKNGLEPDACHRVGDERGEYLAARKVVPGRTAAEILGEGLPDLVLRLPFPKVMRWGEGDTEYPRPLQWIVALLGDEVVPLILGGVVAGRDSRGQRTLYGDGPVSIPDPGAYLDALEAAGVLADHRRRRDLISAGIARLLGERPGARLIEDERLLTEVVFLTEYPTPFLGSFEEEFFAVPPEVIVTALREHQRYFAVENTDGELLPCFLGVRDGGTDHLDNVRAGNERVLRARLADALFYWDFDQRRTPEEHAARLGDVTWLEGFGSVLDKTRRLQGLVAHLWEHGFGTGEPLPAAADRAAGLCKFDQVTEMIRDGKEFTSLEGLIGARYAARAGEEPAVCRAIEQHYLPRSAGGELPADDVSILLSAADRLDNLAGCWLAGFVPTGAKDPYALRRHTLALLRLVLDGERRLSLSVLVARALDGFTDLADEDSRRQAAEQIAAFIRTRLSGLLTEGHGCPPAAVRAALPVHGDDPSRALAWARNLAAVRQESNFQLLATGFKRCKNILEGAFLSPEEGRDSLERWRAGGAGAAGEDFGDLQEEAEIRLRREVSAAVGALEEAETAGDYRRICGLLSDLGPAIDLFFDSVRVNVADNQIKTLRHAFLREIHALFARYADFSEIAPIES